MKYLSISARSCRGNFAPRFRQNQDIFEKPQKKTSRLRAKTKTFRRAKTLKRKVFKYLSRRHRSTKFFVCGQSFAFAFKPFANIRGYSWFLFFTFLKTSRLGGFARKQKTFLSRKDAKKNPANPVLNRLAGDLKWCGWRESNPRLNLGKVT